jgi:hypothetical protein
MVDEKINVKKQNVLRHSSDESSSSSRDSKTKVPKVQG